jgi:hypothetical protein
LSSAGRCEFFSVTLQRAFTAQAVRTVRSNKNPGIAAGVLHSFDIA